MPPDIAAIAHGRDHKDVLVLGSGTGGTALALHLAALGQRVAIVERRWAGGACKNAACLPAKNLIWSARVVDLVRRHGERLVPAAKLVTVDMAQVRRRKRDMVDDLTAATLAALKTNHVELVHGEGRFTAPRAIEVRTEDGAPSVLTADRVIVNVGTHAAIPNIPGLSAAGALTHLDALDLNHVPSHLIVLGGGYAGLEMAQAFRRFGSKVTVIEQGAQLAGQEDADLAAEIASILAEDGLDIITMARVLRVEGRPGLGLRLDVRCPSGRRVIEASHVLVATGRVPNTAGIGLEAAGIDLEVNGYIRVNDRLETSAAATWAIGECAGSPHFTHVSYDDFRIVRDNLAGGSRTTRNRLVPNCMFTDPPLARVGLNEAEARRLKIQIRVARTPMTAVLKTRTTGETAGFMKIVVDARSDRILGFAMIGPQAGEVMAVAQTAMIARMPYTDLRDAVLAHPTMAEALVTLLERVPQCV